MYLTLSCCCIILYVALVLVDTYYECFNLHTTERYMSMSRAFDCGTGLSVTFQPPFYNANFTETNGQRTSNNMRTTQHSIN